MDSIVGMIGHKYVECAEEVEYFTGYIHESALPKDFDICSIFTLDHDVVGEQNASPPTKPII